MATPELYWNGASVTKYGYWSKNLPYSCDPGQNGNYIVTKLVNNVFRSFNLIVSGIKVGQQF